MFTAFIYVIAIIAFLVSLAKDVNKTRVALIKSWKSFSNIFPPLLTVLSLVGLALTVLNPGLISKIIGAETGIKGMIITSVIGAITLIPGFVAFPLAASLLEKGAGIMQLAVFISTLMMVGFATLPLEISYFGRKVAFLRNGLAFIFSFFVAFIIGMVVS